MQITNLNLLLSLNGTQTVAEVPARPAASEVASLTTRIRAGDEEAFREFHARYFDRLYRFLLVVARGQEHEAREALQETLLRVIRHVRRFDCEEAFWSWLKVVARSAARDAGRKQHRYLQLLQKFTFHSQVSALPETGPTDHVLGSSLEQSLESLDPLDRRLVEGKYLEGATVRELASESGLTEKAVESRLLRLRRHLREQILRHLYGK